MAELTPEAQAEIREAIRIVREDRFEAFVRERESKRTPEPNSEPETPPTTPPAPEVAPPPVKTPEVTPPTTEPPKRKGGYWSDYDD